MWTTKRHVTLLVVVILFINCNGFSLDFTDIMDSAMSYIRTEERNAVNVDEIMARFKKSVDDLVDEHLNAFQEAYKIPQTRSKRELPEELDVINDAHYRLTNVTTSEVYNTTLYFGDNVISDVTDFQLDSYMHILMLLQDEDGYSSAVILRQNGSEWNVTEWLDAPAIKDVTSFTVGTDLFIVLVQDSYEDRGTGKVPLTQIRRYKQGATSIEDYSLQRMHTYGASSVTTFDLPHKDTKCMIITKGGLETRSDVYCSLGNYFDHITSVRTSWPNSIEAFTMHDNVHLAVPHMDSLENNPETDSEILVLNLHTESFDHVQYIRTLRAMQFEHISYGTGTFVEHFLILRNQIHADDSDDIPDASIYKYVKGKFVPFQCIHIKNGQIEYLNLIEGDDQKNVLILITNLDVNPIQLYEYDGWRFVPTTVNFEHNNPGIKRAFPGYSFVRGVIFVLLVDYEEHENYVETLHFSSIRPIFDARESAKEACANAELIISTELERFNDIEAAACDLVYTDSRVVITGEKTFVDEITVTNVSHIYQIEGNNGAFFDKSEVSALPEVKENITNIQQRLEVVEGLLNRAMKTVGDQNILGHKTFMNLTTESLNVKSNFILDDMEDVDGVNFTELELDTMKINVDQDLYNRFSFHGGIVFEDGLFVDGNVDGQDPDTVVTLDGTQVIVVEQTFQDQILVEGHAEVFGTVDGIYLNSTSMLLTSGRGDVQVVTGNLTFPDVQFNNIESYGEVDGVKLDELRDNSVHTDGDYNITAVHRFHKMVNINSSLTVTKNHTLDDVDVEVLFNEILKKTVYQQIPANYTFTNLNITNNLDVHGTINGIDIPDDVLQVSQSATLNGNVTFTKDAIISTLDSRSSIDGIASNLEGGNNLDLLKTTGIQTVQFSRTFMDNIVAGNDLNIANKLTVDGVDISMMDSDAVKLNGNQDITGEKVFGSNITIESSLEVYGRINGIDVYDLTKSCVRIHDEMIETSSTITFEGDAVFQGNLDTKGEHSVHGINLHDLVVQGVAETIGGKKTFISDVKSRDDIHVDGLINDLEWEEIDDDAWMLNNTGQLVTVSGSKTFTGDFTISNSFNVTGTIDGVELSDVVTVDGDQIIESVTNFASGVYVESLTVHGDVNTPTINGLDIQNMDNDTLKTTGYQVVLGQKKFNNSLELSSNLTLTGEVNGIDISDLVNDAVMMYGKQMIYGTTFINESVCISELNVTGNIDGVDLNNFVATAVTQGTIQNIMGVKTFDGGIHAVGNVTGLINGVDVDEIDREAIKITDYTFDGDITFDTVVSKNNVNVTGTVDGVDIYLDSITTDYIVNPLDVGSKTFNNSINILGQLSIADGWFIDGVDIDRLSATAVHLTGNQQIPGKKKFLGNVKFGDVSVSGNVTVEEIDLEYLNDNAMKVTTGLDQIVTGVHTYGGNFTIQRNFTIDGLVNGIDVEFLNAQYMSLTKAQMVNSSMNFQGTVYVDYNVSADEIHLYGYLNDVYFMDWSENVLLTNSSLLVNVPTVFSSNITVEDNVYVHGLTDGVDLSHNSMRFSANNNITGVKTFTGGLILEENLVISDGNLIDGVDVSFWAENAVYVDRNFNITGEKTFTEINCTGDLRVYGLVDNVDVSESTLLLKYGKQTITRNKGFLDNVVFSGGLFVTGEINKVDLNDLKNNTMLISENQIVYGTVVFTEETVFDFIEVNGLIDDVDITDLYNSVYSYEVFNTLNTSVEYRCEVLEEMHEAADDVAVYMDYLKLEQVFQNEGTIKWSSFVLDGIQWLAMMRSSSQIVTATCTTSKLYQWNETAQQFDMTLEIKTSKGEEIESFQFDGRQFLIIVNHVDFDSSSCARSEFLTTPKLPAANSQTPPNTQAGEVSIAEWNSTTSSLSLYQKLTSYGASDAEVYVHPHTQELCIAIANKMYNDYNTAIESYIYCMSSLTSGFVWRYSIDTFGANAIKHFVNGGTSHLIVANTVNFIDFSYVPKSEVFSWTGSKYESDTLLTTTLATDVLVLDVHDQKLIVISHENIVDIYRYDENTPGFEYVSEIDVTMPVSMDHMQIGSDEILLVLDQDVGIKVYKYNGESKFVLSKEIPLEHAFSLHAFYHQNMDDYYVAVGTYKALVLGFHIAIQALETDVPIYKVKTSGEYLPTIGCS